VLKRTNHITRNLRVAAIATAAALACAVVSSSSSYAAAHKVTAFGAKLNGSIQPSNSFQPHACREITGKSGACTRILMEAYGRPNTGQLAPKDGTVHEIKLVAGSPGSLIIEVAKVKPASIKNDTGSARIVFKGPKITFNGQGGVDNGGPYTVETFNVHIPVLKGEYLAIYSHSTSLLRCSGGGANQLVYQPYLKKTDPYTKAPYHDGCFLLLEAQY
jgi:hypothetical protein